MNGLSGLTVYVTVTTDRGDTIEWPGYWDESRILSTHNPMYFAQALDEQMIAAHKVLSGKVKKLYGDIREDDNGKH